MTTAERARAVGLLTAIRIDYVAYLHMLIIPVLYVPGGDSHIRTVQVCAARKTSHFSALTAPYDYFFDLGRSKRPPFQIIQVFDPLFRPSQIEKTLVKKLAPNPYFSIINVHLVDIKFVKFYEIPSLPFQGKTKTSRTDVKTV